MSRRVNPIPSLMSICHSPQKVSESIATNPITRAERPAAAAGANHVTIEYDF